MYYPHTLAVYRQDQRMVGIRRHEHHRFDPEMNDTLARRLSPLCGSYRAKKTTFYTCKLRDLAQVVEVLVSLGFTLAYEPGLEPCPAPSALHPDFPPLIRLRDFMEPVTPANPTTPVAPVLTDDEPTQEHHDD